MRDEPRIPGNNRPSRSRSGRREHRYPQDRPYGPSQQPSYGQAQQTYPASQQVYAPPQQGFPPQGHPSTQQPTYQQNTYAQQPYTQQNNLRHSQHSSRSRSRNSNSHNEKSNGFRGFGMAYGARSRLGGRPPSQRSVKDHFVATAGEFVGTVMFLFFAFAWHKTIAVESASTTGAALPMTNLVYFISVGYGFSLLVCAWAFYRISGGLFNPSVTLVMVLTQTLPPVRGLFLLISQLLGGIVAAALVSCMFPGPIYLVQTTLGAGTSVAQGVFIEMFLTSLLCFTILILAAEKHKATFIAPVGIGLSLFVAELAGVAYTGGSLNFARSLGPAVVSRSFPHYFWIYFVGPGLGSLITAGYFHFIKFLRYDEANEGQDSAGGDFV